MAWVRADGAHEVSLSAGKVVCRGAHGKVLRSVPKALADTPVVVGLRQLAEWLARHEAECTREVDGWMVRGLPVPVAALAAVWPDPAWRAALRDLVVAPVGPDGRCLLARAGFLRAADAETLGVVTLDGDTVQLAAQRCVIPHPVLLDNIDEVREFAADLGVEQKVLQLHRETWRKPDTAVALADAIRAYAGAPYRQISHLTARAKRHGYAVCGGVVSQRIWERGEVVNATVWAGDGDPQTSTETGELRFSTGTGTEMPHSRVGPVAWSEGMRLAAVLHAGRDLTDEEDE